MGEREAKLGSRILRESQLGKPPVLHDLVPHRELFASDNVRRILPLEGAEALSHGEAAAPLWATTDVNGGGGGCGGVE
jgi:hypothetical protein